MIQYTDVVIDELSQSPIEGAEVFVYNTPESDGDLASLATLYASDGVTPVVQPLKTNNLGIYSFYQNAGEFTGDVYVGSRLRYRSRLFVGGGYSGAAQAAAEAAKAAGGVGEFANTAAGLAGTEAGQTFWVDNGDGTGTTYRHDAGPVATEIGKFIKDPTSSGASALIGYPGGKKVADLASMDGGRLVVLEDGSTVQETTNALAFGTFDDASSATIPTNINAVRTIGYSVEGIGMADQVYDAAVDPTYVTNNPRSAFISTNGRGFKLGEREPSADMFGALADDGSGSPPDATAAFNYLGEYFADSNTANEFNPASGSFKLPPNLTYRISGSVFLPWFMGGALNGARIVPISGTALSAFDNDAMININVDSSGNQIKRYGGQLQLPRLRDFALWNNNSPTGISTTPIVDGLIGIYSKSKVGPHQFMSNCLWQFFVKAGGSGEEYIDGLSIGDGIIYGTRGSDYPVELLANGDNLRIGNIIFQNDAAVNAKGVFVRNCRGGIIERLINGEHMFETCDALDLVAHHIESGTITLNSCGGTLRNSQFWKKETGPKVIITAKGDDQAPPPLTLEELSFVYGLNDPADYGSDEADIDLPAYSVASVNVRNCYRRMESTTSGGGTSTAAKLSINGSMFNGWNGNAAMNGRGAAIVGGAVYPTVTSLPVATATGTWTSGNSSLMTWLESTATYYWRGWLLFGPPDRLCGRLIAGGELWATMTNGASSRALRLPNQSPLSNNYGYTSQSIMLYRGTTTDTYTKQVIVPMMGSARVWDRGFCTGNGEMWQTVSSVGVASINVNNVSEIRLIGKDNVEIVHSAPPSYGTWKVGDCVINSAPAVAGTGGSQYVVTGWLCVTAGTPGTWVAQRTLTGT